MQRIAQIALALVALGLLRCSSDARATQGKAGPPRNAYHFPVETMNVQTRASSVRLQGVGMLEPNERVHVNAGVSGIVERVLFREGQAVGPDDVLVEIDTQRAKLAVTAARSELRLAQRARSEASASYARRRRASRAHPGIVSREELESFAAKARIAFERVTQAEAALQQALVEQKKAFVGAPIAGVAQAKSVETGQYVQVGAPITMLIRRDPMWLRFHLREADASMISEGLQVSFRSGAEPEPFQATVTYVAQQADATSRMVPILAQLHASHATSSLRPGAFAEVSAVVSTRQNALFVPELALRSGERGFTIFVVEGGVARRRSVTLGVKTDDDTVEIKSGIRAGDTVIIRGAQALDDGSPVRVVKTRDQAAPHEAH